MAEWPYNGPWQRHRDAILQRDGHTSQLRLPGCTHTATAVDHIIPTSAGGPPYNHDNLRATCTNCNTRRSNKPTPTHNNNTYPPPSRTW